MTRFVFAVSALAIACGGSPPPPDSARAHRHEHAPHPHSGHAHHGGSHRFQDAERWSKVFDDPKRDEWQRPDEVVRELALAEDAVVADLGAGTGYFTVRLARAAPKGRVIAIDIEQDMLDWTEKRAQREGIANIETRLGTTDDPKLPEGVDLVLVVDTYHHIQDRSAYFRRVRDSLAESGRVVIVDFKMGKLPVGPPDSHKIPPETIESEMKAAGYALCRTWDGLPYQHTLFFAEKC